ISGFTVIINPFPCVRNKPEIPSGAKPWHPAKAFGGRKGCIGRAQASNLPLAGRKVSLDRCPPPGEKWGAGVFLDDARTNFKRLTDLSAPCSSGTWTEAISVSNECESIRRACDSHHQHDREQSKPVVVRCKEQA